VSGTVLHSAVYAWNPLNLSMASAHARLILLDVEGTTTPVEFVYEVLFPYARLQLDRFIKENFASAEVSADITALHNEHARDAQRLPAPPPWRGQSSQDQTQSAAAYLHWLMDQDRKSTALKSVQGKIWEEGYRTGDLCGQMYEDVPRAFRRWSEEGRDIAIFSSGSILAQKLLFSNSNAGDLTPFIRAYFDTTAGPKKESSSYRSIANTLGRSPSETIFVSDTIAELDAAKSAGMHTALCVRSDLSQSALAQHPVIHNFDEM
jgi:enolase-phosphatase E1